MYSGLLREIYPGLIFFMIVYLMILYPVLFIFLQWRRGQRKKEEKEIKRYTLDFCLKDDINYEDFLSNIDKFNYEHPDEMKNETMLLNILSRFEKISIGLSSGVFDEQIIYTYYGKYFGLFYKLSKYYLIKRREINNDPYMFIEFEKAMNKFDDYYEFKRRFKK